MKIITGYTGTQHIQSADDAAFNSGVVSQANVVLNTGNTLSAQILSGNIVRIGSGDIVCNGRHARIENYEDVKIANGSQGVNRTDAIVARYAKNESTGIESITLQVIKGGNGAAAIPLDGDMLLYYVALKGVNIVGTEPQFNILMSINELTAYVKKETLAQASNLNGQIATLNKKIVDNYNELKASVAENESRLLGEVSNVYAELDRQADTLHREISNLYNLIQSYHHNG